MHFVPLTQGWESLFEQRTAGLIPEFKKAAPMAKIFKVVILLFFIGLTAVLLNLHYLSGYFESKLPLPFIESGQPYLRV